jgi:peptide deformylase
MIYPIVAYGDPVLKKQARDIEKGTDIRKLVEDMFETMYNANGVGLAAPQIGLDLRLFVVDAEPMDPDNLSGFKKAFVNPEIIEEYDPEWGYEEGCLSIPGIRSQVMRPSKLTVRYFDTDWNEHTEDLEGLAARVIQHEYDHIEGILFIDHLSGLKKKLLKGKLTDISKGKVDVDYKMKFPR